MKDTDPKGYNRRWFRSRKEADEYATVVGGVARHLSNADHPGTTHWAVDYRNGVLAGDNGAGFDPPHALETT